MTLSLNKRKLIPVTIKQIQLMTKTTLGCLDYFSSDMLEDVGQICVIGQIISPNKFGHSNTYMTYTITDDEHRNDRINILYCKYEKMVLLFKYFIILANFCYDNANLIFKL